MMKKYSNCLLNIKNVLISVIVFVSLSATMLTAALAPGESLSADLFIGTQTNTSLGNPNADGQGWYMAGQITFVLKYYEGGGTNPEYTEERWAKSDEPGGYPSYLTYSEATWDVNVDGAIRVNDRNSKRGVAWVYAPPVKGTYKLSFDTLYSYPSGAGNSQIWKVAVYTNNAWGDLIDYQNITDNPKGGGYADGTNFVYSLDVEEKIGFFMKTGGGAYSGGTGRIEGLKIKRLALGTVIHIR